MTLVTRPFAQLTALDDIARTDKHNVAKAERTASLVVGALMAAGGLLSRSGPGLLVGLLGGALVYRGATGRCELYRQLGINTALPHAERGVPGNEGINVEVTEHVKRPAGELFHYWRRLENLSQVMPHVVSVDETADGVSHWKVQGPVGTEWEWDSEIIEEQPGKMFAWQTLPGAVVASAGSVWFEPEGDGTRVKVSLQYQPPAGMAGAAVANLLGASPKKRIRQDLARFKEVMEA